MMLLDDLNQVAQTIVNILYSGFLSPMAVRAEVGNESGICKLSNGKDEHPAGPHFVVLRGPAVEVVMVWKSAAERKTVPFRITPTV